MRQLNTLALVLALAGLAGTAQAALQDLGDGTVKDTSTNLIWLKDWNTSGQQNWAAQMAWADGLTFAGSSDWVLPKISDYLGLYSQLGDLTQDSTFSNVLLDPYWSRTEVVDSPETLAWRFRANTGSDARDPKVVARSAVAVRLAVSPVPEPQTWALFSLGLAATGLMLRRKQAA